ncbi:hypothetical protein BDV32DRAFT_131527 [Aspergillus pseudonomiae]|nr:hypothetical protein BDV32DRAFT_131527 [Aspergillus pseudonomiae]
MYYPSLGLSQAPRPGITAIPPTFDTRQSAPTAVFRCRTHISTVPHSIFSLPHRFNLPALLKGESGEPASLLF